MTAATLTMETAVPNLFKIKGVVRGFVQHTAGVEEYEAAKVPGGAGAWIMGVRDVNHFRVVIYTDKGFAEVCEHSLALAIQAALAKLKIEAPAWLSNFQ